MQKDVVKIDKAERGKQFASAICAALLIPVTVVVTGMTIYLANKGEMISDGVPLLKFSVFCGGVAALLLAALQFTFWRCKKLFVLINAIIIGIGILFWLQSNVFLWNFGKIDGGSIDWTQFQLQAWFEALCYLAIFSLVIIYRNRFSRYAVHIACILVLVQFVPIVQMVGGKWFKIAGQIVGHEVKQTRDESWKQYEFSLNSLADYSKDSNVFIIILDAFGARIFEEIQEYKPESVQPFTDFTFFPQCRCDIPSTFYCVPSILTGSDIAESDKKDSALHFARSFSLPYYLFPTLHNAGYQCSVYSSLPCSIKWDTEYLSNIRKVVVNDIQEIGTMRSKQVAARKWNVWLRGISQYIDLVTFRLAPTLIKPFVFEHFGLVVEMLKEKAVDSADEYATSDGFYANIDSDSGMKDSDFFVLAQNLQWRESPQKQLKYIHLYGAHTPYRMDEFGKPAPLVGVNAERQQALGSLTITKYFLDKLKENGVYDKSLIIVMADHGPRGSETAGRVNPAARYRPLLLVKRPDTHQDSMQVNAAPVHIKDTTPGILTELHLKRPDDAFSWFNMPKELVEQRNQEWKYFWDSYKTDDRTVQFTQVSNDVFAAWNDAEPVTLQRIFLSTDENKVVVELLGDDADPVGKIGMSPIKLILTPHHSLAAGRYISDVLPKKTFPGGYQVRNWASQAALDFTGVADGEYDISVMLSSKNKLFQSRLGTITVNKNTGVLITNIPFNDSIKQ